MANKRLSELNELQAIEIQPDDLALTTDVSVLESKKLRFQTLKNWILNDPGSITASNARISDSSSYLIYVGNPNGTASYSISSSYVISSSWSNIAGISIYADTASYIDGNDVDGNVSNAINALTASHLIYQGYYNGSASYALTSSYVENSRTSSYIWYTGVPNGTASYALNCASSGAASSETASYLYYNGSRPNGTASYSLKSEQVETASYLYYNGSRPNGTASFSITSSWSRNSNISSQSYFLNYNGSYNGTASYAMNSAYADLSQTTWYARLAGSASWTSQSLNSNYAVTASRVEGSASYASTSSYCTGTSSYALVSNTIIDTNMYRIWGPYKSTDSGGTNTTTEQMIQNFIISPPTVSGNTIIIMALFDVKCPITTTDTDTAKVELFLEYSEPGNTWTYGPIDTTKPNNYINLTLSVSGAISGYNRTAATLAHDWPNVSGSWWSFVIRSSGGALIDTNRGTTFFLYTKTDTNVTKTAFPPF